MMMSLLCPGHLSHQRSCQHMSYRLTLILSLVITIFFVVYLNSNVPRDSVDTTKLHLSSDKTANQRRDTRFIVDTPGCTIPDVDPFDPSLKDIVSQGGELVCGSKPALTYTDGRSLKINHTALLQYYNDELDRCQFEPIIRPPEAKSDNVYRYLAPVEFVLDVTDAKTEFVRVACFGKSGHMIYANFHTFVFTKDDVEDKKNTNFERFKETASFENIFNFLIVGVDSVSRLNFVRQMSQTRRYLMEHLNAVELKGYNKVADNTFVNLSPMFAGRFTSELPWDEQNSDATFDDCPFIWYDAASVGYRTLFAEDAPNIAIFNYEKAGFKQPPADYYLRPFSLAVEEHGSIWTSNHSCIGPKPETQVVLDYVTDFMHLFENEPKLAFSFITRLTHEGINKAGAADPLYLKFFKDLQNAGQLDNTVILFYSDHGMRFGAIRETYIGQLEERLPFVLLSLPPTFHERFPEYAAALSRNAHRLTTPFDIHVTLSSLLKFKGSIVPNDLDQRGMNLLMDIPEERTCATALVHSHWCTCHKQEVVDPNSDLIQVAAQVAVDHINNLLSSSHGTACASLVFDKVIEARRIIPNTNMASTKTKLHDFLSNLQFNSDHSVDEYVVVFRTSPGEALFEANIRKSDVHKSVTVHGDISRINAYGDQSACIQYFDHKKFCFCAE